MVQIIRLILYFVLAVIIIIYPITALILLIAVLIAFVVTVLSHLALKKRSKGNGVIYGGRRKGKGQLLNRVIQKDKTKPFVNVPYFKTLVKGEYLLKHFTDLDITDVYADEYYILDAKTNDFKVWVDVDTLDLPKKAYKKAKSDMYYHTELLTNLDEYFNSLNPLTIKHFMEGNYQFIVKNNRFEGRNVYVDDVNVYFANWEEKLLKQNYPSTPPLLAILGHVYGAYCVITTQDLDRPWKILRELQTDFSIKALKTYGYGSFWQVIPILHFFRYTKYVYHELPKSADMLPFKAVGVVNETLKHGYLTSGQATKEVYEATHGQIRYGFSLQLAKNISYDTRFFHRLTYGYGAPKK